MLLTADDGSELELKLLGYESPHARGASDDWLVLFIRMKVGSETWEARDPALVREEARDLSNWLDGIARDDPSAGWSIDFTEPVHVFEAFRRTPTRSLCESTVNSFKKSLPGNIFQRYSSSTEKN